jgi:hypothetical protein
MYSTRGATLTMKGPGPVRPAAPPPRRKVEEKSRKAATPKTAKLASPAAKPAAKPAPPAVVDPEAAAAKAARQAEREAARRRVEALLRERWPAVFCVPRPPLAIGVHRQILEFAGNDIDEAELGWFFRWWVRQLDYLDAIAHGEPRLNLDGSEAGIPTEEEQRRSAIDVYGQERGPVVLAKIQAAKETQ